MADAHPQAARRPAAPAQEPSSPARRAAARPRLALLANRSAQPAAQGHAPLLDAGAAAAVVVVALGAGRHLGDRAAARGGGRSAARRWRCSVISSRRPPRRLATGSITSSPSSPTEFVADGRRRERRAVPRRQRLELLNNGDAFYPAMLDAIEAAEASITIEAYIYWAGDIGRDASPRRWRGRRGAGCRVKILLDAIGSATHRRRDPQDARRRRLPGRLVQPDPLVHARALQQPDPPQVADRRRPRRVHRRRRHRRSVARQRPRSRRMARHADPASRGRRWCRCRPGSPTTGSRRPAS